MKTRDKCPLCGAAAADAKPFITTAKNYDLFKCPKCGLVYGKDVLDGDDLFAVYDAAYAANYERPELVKQNRAYADRFFADKPRGRVLEVGCGTGQYLRRLAELGFTAKGVEASEALAAYAKDLDITVTSFERAKVPAPAARFDYVVMFHVLEHFVDPIAAVTKLAKFLKPGGVWFNYMPNVAVAIQPGDAHGPGWIHFKPTNPAEHITFFDAETIKVLARKAGLEVVDGGAESDDFWTWARKPADAGQGDG